MVFTEKEEITLADNSIVYVVAQLQKYSLTGTSHQVVSDAFESIISYASKGSQGQFFTPKNVIDLMVNFLKPQRYKTMIDIACGSYVIIVLVLKSLIKARVLVLLQKIKDFKINNLCVV